MLNTDAIKRVLRAYVRVAFENLKGESDRGAVLVAATYCDELLRELLSSVLIRRKAICKRLFDYPGPLSTFGARNDLARAMGLTRHREFHAIEMLRRIRNRHAAHSAKQFSFADPEVKALCAEMAKGEDRVPDRGRGDRDVFLKAVAALIGALSGHVEFYLSVKERRPNDALLEILAPWPAGDHE